MKFFLLMILGVLTLWGQTMTPKQLRVLQSVRDVAKSIPDKNGKTYENTLSAICLTESDAGDNNIGDYHRKKSITKASLGPMQIQVRTARHVAQYVKKLSWLQELSDIQIAARLLGDVKLSAKIATYYVVLLHEQRRNSFHAVSGYNGGMNNHPYYQKVMKNMVVVQKLVASGQLS